MPAEQRNAEASGFLSLRGDPLPYVRLRRAFSLPGEIPKKENIVVVKINEFYAGIAVDELLGGMQTVVKPLGRAFRTVHGIAGSTVLGDGSGIILDVPSLSAELCSRVYRRKLRHQTKSSSRGKAMKTWQDQKIGTRLGIVFGAILLFVIVAAGVGLTWLNHLNSDMSATLQKRYNTVQLTHQTIENSITNAHHHAVVRDHRSR